ncbi:MAG TPA: M56 family metallopeptidase [Steroidobacteraceae bacterium]|nr:M56 family metallopeptidase [Steroidobacteraceae bacterium]
MISALLDHLWQSTLFGGGAWLLTLALRGNAAAVRHGLWVAAAVKFLVPFSALFALGAVFGFATPVDASPPMLSVAEVATPVISPAFSLHEAARDPAPVLLGGLLAVWLTGAVVVAVRWARAWRAAERITSAARRVPGSPADVRIVDADVEPAVARVFRPVVLLPAALLAKLSPPQLDAIVAHERAHIARRDNLSAHLQRLVETVFWFHPLVWWIGRQQVDERERACDESVIEQGHDGAAYAEGILAVCRHSFAATRCAATASALSGDLTLRIRGILGGARPRALGVLKAAALSVASIAVAAGPLAAGAVDDAARRRESLAHDVRLLDSAVIYVAPAGGGRAGVGAEANVVHVRNSSLRELVAAAYDVHLWNVTGGGDWLDSPRYEFRAELPGVLADPDDFDPRALRGVVNKLLASRFDLGLYVNRQCQVRCGDGTLVADSAR